MTSGQETISIATAMRRGTLTVNLPVLAILFGGMFGGCALVIAYAPPIGANWAVFVGFPIMIASFPIGWLYWSLNIPRWKLWAYSRVENINDLKDAAIKSGLIWPGNYIFEKTEICSKAIREQILKLEGRL